MAKTDLNTYFQTALVMYKSGKFQAARKLFLEILRHKPAHLESLSMMGQSWFQDRNFENALGWYEKGLNLQKDNMQLLLQKGRTLTNLRRFEEASSLFVALKNENQNQPQILFHGARNFKEIGRYAEAIDWYEKLIEVDPKHMQGLNNLGNVYQQIHAYEKAIKCYDQMIDLDNRFMMAYCNKAGLLQKKGELDNAEILYYKALELEKNPMIFYNLGIIEGARHNHQKSLAFYEKAIKLAPENHKYLSAYASALYSRGEINKAVQLLQKLIQGGSSSQEPYIKLGKILITESKYKAVIELLEECVQYHPHFFESFYLLGVAYELDHQLDKAELAFEKAAGHQEFALRANMNLQMLYPKMGRLNKYNEMVEKLSLLLKRFVSSEQLDEEIPVYNLSYFPFDQELIKQVTVKFTQGLIRRVMPLRKQMNFQYQPKTDRLKIGYLSPHFKNHPAGTLIQGVLKNHDRERFEIYGYGINCGDDFGNQQIRALVDHYEDVGDLRLEEAAARINQDGIHILVNMAGYNLGMKTEIPALRPSPVQVVCMDCHESIQGDFYDYVFKDEEVITPTNRAFFSESIAMLPPSHFFNVELMTIDKMANKSDYGLPDDVFVFGCLNHPRKVNPQAFDAWCAILKQVDHSVLWLYDGGYESYRTNIREEASKRAINTDRILFCGKENQREHYLRMGLIDLFLDTPIYNGHTTCLEALWMNVPVLTLRGSTVSARLCSSFLVALGMDDMICEDSETYIEKAVELASDKEEIDKMKAHLTDAYTTNDFFNSQVLTQRMEQAYEQMWSHYTTGKQPSDFEIV